MEEDLDEDADVVGTQHMYKEEDSEEEEIFTEAVVDFTEMGEEVLMEEEVPMEEEILMEEELLMEGEVGYLRTVLTTKLTSVALQLKVVKGIRVTIMNSMDIIQTTMLDVEAVAGVVSQVKHHPSIIVVHLVIHLGMALINTITMDIIKAEGAEGINTVAGEIMRIEQIQIGLRGHLTTTGM
mmetsp:Transcript_62738/g.75481  ORF Transcript_62738/g.75481 Transcript_62738/m.75481 type:complete len:182 (-) Transcript_62738:237-782(-)